MKHDILIFDHYFPAALQVIGAQPSSHAQAADYVANRAAQLVLAALDVREHLLKDGSIAFDNTVPAQSYPRSTAPMGTGISVQVHAPGGNPHAGQTPPAPQPPAQYTAPPPQAPPPPYAPPPGPPHVGQPYTSAPVAPTGISVQVSGPGGQPVP